MTPDEKLLEWRQNNGLSQEAAGKKAGLTKAAWQSYESGTIPKTPAAVAIERVTDGAVKVSDWMESEVKRAERRARSKMKRVSRRHVVAG